MQSDQIPASVLSSSSKSCSKVPEETDENCINEANKLPSRYLDDQFKYDLKSEEKQDWKTFQSLDDEQDW